MEEAVELSCEDVSVADRLDAADEELDSIQEAFISHTYQRSQMRLNFSSQMAMVQKEFDRFNEYYDNTDDKILTKIVKLRNEHSSLRSQLSLSHTSRLIRAPTPISTRQLHASPGLPSNCLLLI